MNRAFLSVQTGTLCFCTANRIPPYKNSRILAAALCKMPKSTDPGRKVLASGPVRWYDVVNQDYNCTQGGDNMPDRRFLLVDADVLPDVFVKVLQAKELLASGAVTSISAAARQAGISRSAFYKYKDTVFNADAGRESITVVATLLDKTGALQTLLSGISAAGASIVTITQSRPENGAAQVEVTVRTGMMQMPVEEMLTRLSHQPCVVEIHRGA